MEPPSTTTRRPGTSNPPSTRSPKQTYLLGYNALCLLLWGTVTLRALLLIPTLATHSKLYGLYHALHALLTLTQSLALLEVLHSVLGLVRSSPVTTAMQVASRILLVWGVIFAYPDIIVKTEVLGTRSRDVPGMAGGSLAYAGCLMAWGVTEIIRYGFFVLQLSGAGVPAWLTWLRYNTFFVLYPLGISSECWLIWLASQKAAKSWPVYSLVLRGVLLVYVPGSYILYTHMMAQRRRVIKGKGKSL